MQLESAGFSVVNYNGIVFSRESTCFFFIRYSYLFQVIEQLISINWPSKWHILHVKQVFQLITTTNTAHWPRFIYVYDSRVWFLISDSNLQRLHSFGWEKTTLVNRVINPKNKPNKCYRSLKSSLEMYDLFHFSYLTISKAFDGDSM